MAQRQNSAARTDQIEVLTEHFMTAGFPPIPARTLAEDTVEEAEARGAAEQRARDSKECDAKCGFILEGSKGRFRLVNLDGAPLNELVTDKYYPLYYRPFNMDNLKLEISRLSILLNSSEESLKAAKKENIDREDKHLKVLSDATDELRRTHLCCMREGER